MHNSPASSWSARSFLSSSLAISAANIRALQAWQQEPARRTRSIQGHTNEGLGSNLTDTLTRGGGHVCCLPQTTTKRSASSIRWPRRIPIPVGLYTFQFSCEQQAPGTFLRRQTSPACGTGHYFLPLSLRIDDFDSMCRIFLSLPDARVLSLRVREKFKRLSTHSCRSGPF